MPRIVIVDDDANCIQYLERLVRGRGHDVVAFNLGEDAIARGTKPPPDLLIADWLLREQLDGAAVVRAFRDLDPSLPVIIISGMPRYDLGPIVQQLGNAVLVEKPIDFASLCASIDRFTMVDSLKLAPQ